MLAWIFGARDEWLRVRAGDQEPVTWGASDPTWSPDGKQLAFSLFGGIWTVPVDGGTARQITDSEGYHTHPAWSPRGDAIAFVRGDPPRGRTLTVPGNLVIVDLASGQERSVPTPYTVTGRLAWSPDGKRIDCALDVPGSGSLLYEVDLESGRAEQLQYKSNRGNADTWMDVAWGAARNELYFTSRRGGVAQVWSMPAGKPPFLVQLPLTSYRAGDVALLDSLSPAPDGSSVVYSAAVVNGRGNYELYRVPAEGGKPEAITNTSRDEFSPAVSPDGKLIAYVSNQFGNIDLFVMPVGGGRQQHVLLKDLQFRQFRQPAGRVRVKVLNELGQPTPVRLYVQASDGKAYCPAASPIYYYPLDPGGVRQGFFIGSGDDSFAVPSGTLQLVALKGIEYHIAERAATVSPDRTTEITIQMERWTNWGQRGWYAGDNHFHANYNGSYYQRPMESMAWVRAVDLNYANMVVANSEGAFVHDKEFFRGEPDPLSTEKRILYWGQEYRNSDPLGHLGFLNLKTLVPPFYTSVVGSDSPYDFPLNTMAAEDAHKQGGLVTYMHAMTGARNDVFDGGFTAREAPVTAALGALDAVDIMPLFGGQPFELWYSLLNAGFRLAPGAGTDTFTNYRGITRLPGMAREYVDVGDKFDATRFAGRFHAGHVFVTNGPLVSFTVNGQPMGSVIKAAGGERFSAHLAAEVSSIMPLEKMEFLENGKVIETQQIDPSQHSARMEKDVRIERSSWFAVRVSGRPARGVPDDGIPRAHSGPVYISVGGKPVLVKSDVELMIRWVNRLWVYLEQRDNFGSEDNRRQAREMFDQALRHYRQKLADAM